MLVSKRIVLWISVTALWGGLTYPGLLSAQQVVRDSLACFPADTQEVAYSNFAQLRSSSDYPQIRQHVLFQQFRGFQAFLQSIGLDPEKDVDEVMLGWRGQSPGGSGAFGVAAGRFEPDKVQDFFTQSRLPLQSYAGSDLLAFGSGLEPTDTFFTFLDSALSAFGRLHDLKALLDVRQGSGPALEANQAFRSYETELDGTAPQWGILTGKAAANVAAPWFSNGSGTVDLTAFLAPVQAVLYRVDWGGGFMARITLICNTPQSASSLLGLLNLLKQARATPPAGGDSGPPAILQNLDVVQNGARLELSASGPAEALDQVLRVGE